MKTISLFSALLLVSLSACQTFESSRRTETSNVYFVPVTPAPQQPAMGVAETHSEVEYVAVSRKKIPKPIKETYVEEYTEPAEGYKPVKPMKPTYSDIKPEKPEDVIAEAHGGSSPDVGEEKPPEKPRKEDRREEETIKKPE